MNNFFNKHANPNPTPINTQYNGMKNNYEQIFVEAAESIRSAIDKFKPENPCSTCVVKDCQIQNKDVFTDFPSGCAYREWQLQVLAFLNGDYRQKLKNTYKTSKERPNSDVSSFSTSSIIKSVLSPIENLLGRKIEFDDILLLGIIYVIFTEKNKENNTLLLCLLFILLS